MNLLARQGSYVLSVRSTTACTAAIFASAVAQPGASAMVLVIGPALLE
jgi:hypothetical protein